MVVIAPASATLIASLNHGKKAVRAPAGARRHLSRKKKRGYKGRAKVCRVGRLRAQLAATRRDFLHKSSADIVKSLGMVALEK